MTRSDPADFAGLRTSPRLHVVPCRLRAASAFVALHHRHHRPPRGGLFAVGVAVHGADDVCGVAIVGRPVSRRLDDGEPERMREPCGACLCGIDLVETGRAAGYEATVPEHGMWVEWRRPE